MADFGLPHITEKRYLALAPMVLTANGSADGLITVASTYRIKVGQVLTFKSSSVSIRLAKVKRVISTTQFVVIDPKDPVTTLNKLDMSDILTADTATVELTQDKRPVIELLEIQRQTYEEEPTVAMRTHVVDWLGRSYSKSNPVPVELSDGSISIGTVNAELEVQLSHQDNVPDVGDVHDSVRIGDGAHTLEINSDGSINVTDNGGSLTVDGTINIGNFPATQNVAIVSSVELEIKNDSGNPVPVNGTVTANQGTNPWAISGSVNASQSGTWTVAVSSIPEVEIKNDSGNPVPVNGTVSANQSGTWNINNITGTVSLPTGAATSALQTTGNSSLASIDGKLPTLGQKTMAGSVPVAIASNQSAIPVTDNGGSLTVDGTVNIGNFPATQNVAVTSIVEVEVKNDSGNALPVTGTVVVSSLPEVEIKNDSGNPIPVNGTVAATQSGSWTMTVNQGTTPWIVDGSSSNAVGNTDAFGRTRTSNPFTLFDSSFRYGDNIFKWNHVTNGGAGSSVSHLANESTMALNVTNSGNFVIRETKKVFAYQPGKSLLILNTFAMSPSVNLLQELGYGGENDGIFFRRENGINYFVKRTSTSGSPVETLVAQSSWNKNTLPALDPSKTQIFWMDIEWLGVGSVRCGFVVDGAFVHCHSFHHANIETGVYMKTATLPIRYRIVSGGDSGTMKQICSTVISEGGYVNTSQTRSVGNTLTGVNLSELSYRPLVSLRLKSTHLDAVAVPDSFDVYGLQQSAYKWQIILNPTLTNEAWTSAGATSCIEYDISANGLSGGTVLAEGIFVGSNKGGTISIKKELADFTLQLGRTIGGVSDILCLAAIATTNNDDAIGSIIWQEHS
jgi:hypothetical protein